MILNKKIAYMNKLRKKLSNVSVMTNEDIQMFNEIIEDLEKADFIKSCLIVRNGQIEYSSCFCDDDDRIKRWIQNV